MLTTIRQERRDVMERILEVESDAAEAHRAWIVEGKPTAAALRAERQAELAALRLRRIRLDFALKNELAAQPRPDYHDTLLSHLCAVLKEQQLDDLIDVAKDRLKQGEPA